MRENEGLLDQAARDEDLSHCDSHIYDEQASRSEDADMPASTSLQLVTVSIDTSLINSPNGTHGDMKMNERRLP